MPRLWNRNETQEVLHEKCLHRDLPLYKMWKGVIMAYRIAHSIGMKARYSGIGERPPEPHNLTYRHVGSRSEQQQKVAWELYMDMLISDNIRMEEDSIRKYNSLISEIKIFPTDLATRAKMVEILEHIKREDVNHVGLLKRLKG